MRCGLVPILTLLVAVAACGPLPQPFRHDVQSDVYPLAEIAFDVRVDRVEGLPIQASRALTRAVAKALGGYGVTASNRPEAASRFLLRGQRRTPDIDRGEIYDLLIHWTLIDEEGETVGFHTQGIYAADSDWRTADPGFIGMVGAEAAGPIAALAGVDADIPDSGVSSPRGLLIDEVSGAPGDGNAALARALRHALKRAGMALAGDLAGAAFIVRGQVIVDPPNENRQGIEIIWRISRPDGEVVGEARQENVIEAGSLDGAWGVVANFAATAAIDGIFEILRKAERQADRPIALPPATDLQPPPANRL